VGLLEGKVAIISGGAFGIGRATARAMARAGAAVVIGDLFEQKAQLVADSIHREGGTAIARHLDVGDDDSTAALVQQAVDSFGGVDLVDHNAARTDFQRDLTALDVDLETWDAVHRVNETGALHLARHAIPVMIERGGGSIVNISSGSASIGERSRVAYGASKAGVEQLTRHLANRYGQDGIRANAVAPGFVVTESAERGVPEAMRDVLARQNPMRRLGTPDDIANVVVFLLSDKASYINGQVIHVDGGTQIAGVLASAPPGD
jgi:NAD(P)-dependent dehydrogenase (short-subunit alcohol dehydrogenase family)